ncbi:MAG: undecaprenyl-phosphate galactose phosphotransferase WbaP [Bryobacterales bacterium]|nr:undecaprenyl-phosphate galactose phosphotransferase WbaP [Bryobacteraceae bacterium]MDW8355594.1 undecaprenyl-phosphate galactose phosphotransferase WbaP [Bryobacterales bacterium]
MNGSWPVADGLVGTFRGTAAAHSAAVPAASPLRTAAVLAAADLAALTLALMLGTAFWLLLRPTASGAVAWSAWPIAVVCVGAFALLGLYPGVGINPAEELRRLAVGITLVYLAVSAAMFLGKQSAAHSRGVYLSTWAAAMLLAPLARGTVRHACGRKSWWGAPVLVVGRGEAASTVLRRLQEEPALGWKPVAALDEQAAQRLAAESSTVGRIRHVLVAVPEATRAELLSLVERLGMRFPHVMVVPDLFGMASLWVSARDLNGVLGLEIRQNLLSPFNRWLKRALDIVLAAAGGLLALPIILLAAVWIRRASPGPAFYSQLREGHGGRQIRIWKLRTMHPNSEQILHRHLESDPVAQEQWRRFRKLKQDPRVLPGIGRLLRRTSLDELPQLWNVLKGEMSLVGPRPFPEDHLAEFPAEFRALRARVRPGLTGLWQVSARSDGDLSAQQRLDAYYIRNWSLWLDLYILARTVKAVLSARGAY